MVGATEKQVKFIEDLVERKNLWSDSAFFDAHNAMDKGEFEQALERMKAEAFESVKAARKLITWLLTLPDKPEEDEVARRDRQVTGGTEPNPAVFGTPLEGRSFSDEELNKLLAALGVYIGETDGDVETFDLYNKILGYLGAEPVAYPDYLVR